VIAFAVLLMAQALTLAERQDFERGIELHLASDLDGALRVYAAIAESHPEFIPNRLYRAEALWLLGKREEAKSLLASVPSDLLLVRVLQKTFQPGGADALAERLFQAYPLEQKRFLATGTPALILLSMGEFEEAIADFRRVSALDPDDATLHRQIGTAFAAAKLYLPAIEALERVVAVVSEDVSAWRQLGSANLVLQRWEPARAALERAIELAGEEEGLLLALGYAHERIPDVERALELYRRASRLAPRSGRPHYRIGRALMAQGNLEEAEKEFLEAASLDPKMAEPLGFLGELQLKRGANALALETLERAVAVSPEYFEAYYHLAQAYRRLGRTDEAREAVARYQELKQKKRGVLSQEEVLAIR
jgi:tetratricopeptide (TPR) repeat protein